MPPDDPPSCPLPTTGPGTHVTLAHGEGGRLMRQLLRDTILPIIGSTAHDDAAQLPRLDGPLVVSTDSYVVAPLEFPGGNIGSLAVNGTVNDLAVSGARCRWMSLSLILEEGLPISKLTTILQSLAEVADALGIRVVTGDTKVVPRGAADGLFINTTGIGEMLTDLPGPSQLQPDDQILVTGPIGRHGMAVMCLREQLAFEPPPVSDSGSLLAAVSALVDAGVPIRAMRDATRGGVAAVLHEWAEASQQSMLVEEESIPVCPATRGVCEVLGLDPLHVANEGTMLVAVPADAVDHTVQVLAGQSQTESAARIGAVRARSYSPVVVRRAFARELPLDEPSGAPLPRIC